MSGSNSWEICVYHRIRGKYEYIIRFVFHEFDPLISRTNSFTNSKIRNSWEICVYDRVRGCTHIKNCIWRSSSCKIHMYMIEFVDAPKSRIVFVWTKSSLKDECLSLLYVTFTLISRLFQCSIRLSLASWCKREWQLYWELKQLYHNYNNNCIENWNSHDVRVKDTCPSKMTVTFTLISRLFRFSILLSLASWCKREWQLYWELKQSWCKSERHLFLNDDCHIHSYITTVSILNTNIIVVVT